MLRSSVALRIAYVLACLLVCKTVLVVLLTLRDYFPPNFRSDFLLGRDAYFFGPYQWAFYAHIFSCPFALMNGLILISHSVRRRFPKWHRRLGKAQVVCVLFLVAPSGLWMACYAATGAVAATGFATLAFAGSSHGFERSILSKSCDCSMYGKSKVRQLCKRLPSASTVYAGGKVSCSSS